MASPRGATPGSWLAGPTGCLWQPGQAAAAHGQAGCAAATTTPCFLPHFLPAPQLGLVVRGRPRAPPSDPELLPGLAPGLVPPTAQPPPARRQRPGNTPAPAPVPRIGEVPSCPPHGPATLSSTLFLFHLVHTHTIHGHTHTPQHNSCTTHVYTHLRHTTHVCTHTTHSIVTRYAYTHVCDMALVCTRNIHT